jgi:hypothetical protein
MARKDLRATTRIFWRAMPIGVFFALEGERGRLPILVRNYTFLQR